MTYILDDGYFGMVCDRCGQQVFSCECQLEDEEPVELIKDASEVTGIWDLTGGENPVDFIRRIRGEG